MHAVDDLFRAIAAGDEAWIKRLYDWKKFFPDVAPRDLDAMVDAYVKRLVERVRPAIEGRERIPTRIALGSKDATIAVALRDRATRAITAEYEFTLADEGSGWTIVKIKP
jgi:hypothetical protein